MPDTGFEIVPVSDQRLASGSGNDEELVMDMLSSEYDTIYSFQGMKRRLGLHQEKLTRILRRLEDDNLVLKTDEGYRVLKHPRQAPGHPIFGGEPVIRGHLPPGTSQDAFMSRLKARWFKNFRWLGYTDTEKERSLYWITEDGKFQVGVQLTPTEVLVWAQPTDPREVSSPVAAGYELFDRISHLLPAPGENS